MHHPLLPVFSCSPVPVHPGPLLATGPHKLLPHPCRCPGVLLCQALVSVPIYFSILPQLWLRAVLCTAVSALWEATWWRLTTWLPVLVWFPAAFRAAQDGMGLWRMAGSKCFRLSRARLFIFLKLNISLGIHFLRQIMAKQKYCSERFVWNHLRTNELFRISTIL